MARKKSYDKDEVLELQPAAEPQAAIPPQPKPKSEEKKQDNSQLSKFDKFKKGYRQ